MKESSIPSKEQNDDTRPCPLCSSNLRLRQINLTKAIWFCEIPDCPYPISNESGHRIETVNRSLEELRRENKQDKQRAIARWLDDMLLEGPPTPASVTEDEAGCLAELEALLGDTGTGNSSSAKPPTAQPQSEGGGVKATGGGSNSNPVDDGSEVASFDGKWETRLEDFINSF